VRVTRLAVVLQCVARVAGEVGANEMQPGVDEETVFSLSELVFAGDVRLGHGEKLERSVALRLPPKLDVPFPKEKDPSIFSKLSIIVEDAGVVLLEHEEDVKLDLPVQYQVTLSQM
jgi:hypothetical protein